MPSNKKVPRRGHAQGPEAVRKEVEQLNRRTAADRTDAAPRRPPGCVGKLLHGDPAVREAACEDIGSLVLDPGHFEELRSHRVWEFLQRVATADRNAAVRKVAFAALRNYCAVAGDAHVDAVCDAAFVGALLANVFELVERVRNGPVVVASSTAAAAAAAPAATEEDGDDAADGEPNGGGEEAEGEEKEEEEAPLSPEQAAQEAYETAIGALDEAMQLAALLAEASEPAANAMTAADAFLPCVLAAAMVPAVQVSAARLLHVISAENERVAAFLASGLTADQREFLVRATTVVPVSPTALLLGVHLCGVLLNSAPTEANVRCVLPVLGAALSHAPLAGIQRALPLLARDCALAPEVRAAGVGQAVERLRALQAALDVASTALGVACEAHGDEEDDEAAFGRNALRPALVAPNGGLVPAVLGLARTVLAPIDDAIARTALRSATLNSDVAQFQQLYISVEVGVCSALSAVMLLVPLASVGPAPGIWRATMTALQERLGMLHARDQNVAARDAAKRRRAATEEDLEDAGTGDADPDDAAGLRPGIFASPHARAQLMLQLESLAEVCWTIQRKDVAGAALPDAADLDSFTRLAWETGTTESARVFSIGAVAQMAAKTAKAGDASGELNKVCGKFCVGMLGDSGPDSASPSLDVCVAAADALIDLYSDERFDATAYVPLRMHAALKAFAPVLAAAVKSLPRRTPQRAQCSEVLENLTGFLEYKRNNVTVAGFSP